MTDSAFHDNHSDVDAAAIYIEGATGWLERVEITDNTAANNGGAVVLYAGSEVDVLDSTFEANSAGTTGGAMLVFGSTASLRGTTFSGNQSEARGGALALFDDSHGSVEDCAFVDNGSLKAGGIGVDLGSALEGVGVDFSVNEPDDVGKAGESYLLGEGATFACGAGTSICR